MNITFIIEQFAEAARGYRWSRPAVSMNARRVRSPVACRSGSRTAHVPHWLIKAWPARPALTSIILLTLIGTALHSAVVRAGERLLHHIPKPHCHLWHAHAGLGRAEVSG